MDKSTDLFKVFTEEVYSISFHPSGLHVLAGFSDKVRDSTETQGHRRAVAARPPARVLTDCMHEWDVRARAVCVWIRPARPGASWLPQAASVSPPHAFTH
eukprot:1838140-Pleurochrysis_carterae.AAC.3